MGWGLGTGIWCDLAMGCGLTDMDNPGVHGSIACCGPILLAQRDPTGGSRKHSTKLKWLFKLAGASELQPQQCLNCWVVGGLEQIAGLNPQGVAKLEPEDVTRLLPTEW